MRITNKTLSDNFLADMQRNLENLSKVQQQVSSTKNFSKPSDDPINVERAMQLQSSVNYTTQYGSNIKTANTWMETTDTTLGQIGTVLSNIRNNLEQAGGVYTQDEKDKINDAVSQEVQQVATLLNTNFQGEYIFGGTAGLSKPITTTTDANGIVSLQYADKDGNAVQFLPSVESSGFDKGNWEGKSITFTVDGKDYKVNLNSSYSGIDDVVKDLNNKIQGNNVTPTPANPPTAADPGVRDKINVVKTDDGNIKIVAINSSDTITLKDSDVSDLSSAKGKQLSNMTMENIGADKNIEISQGVVLSYNATASDMMQYGNNYNTTSGDSINALVNRIQHHLAGQVLNDAAAGDPDAINIPNSDGTPHYYVWKTDEDAAKKELIGQDLTDIDAASKNVLAIRSKIGAKEQRMSDLSTQNGSSITDLKEVLSKTEDIDITQKTIEYYTSITVYQACLQTGGKVIQPTLLDYIK
ncbi:flagellar hook-associated protein FlgL [Clostridium autoethanogenum]|uniref:Flagellar hook-associated protein FlgL n=1 Tax=Clostridium autoethanogenum DSM 10061 TaxID=1341692 RepID=A0ABM5NXN7_9CLOT|nr:flagellar hook-associated protein FlgL [Clostridium autoethanogenum]AGY77250.1 flagellar hook-associated protein FlgL [Clostridium autoethanogenum DSM 10061]ALU37392.1 Flagellar hook-associated protein [Clostridium autoethanogenum DSM 10061]OVY50040.1 flagellar hook-associated protein FlgL [Clostridium autoethanogenum]